MTIHMHTAAEHTWTSCFKAHLRSDVQHSSSCSTCTQRPQAHNLTACQAAEPCNAFTRLRAIRPRRSSRHAEVSAGHILTSFACNATLAPCSVQN